MIIDRHACVVMIDGVEIKIYVMMITTYVCAI